MSGRGGSPDADGQDAGAYWLGNLSNTPVEVIEAENPLLIEEYSFLPDTGGPGRHRGALGIARQYRFLAEEVTVQQRADRHIHACWGLFGGGSGALGRSFYVDAAGTRSEAPSKFVRRMRRNEIFRAEMPGSGGHGEAFSRDTAAVAEDVRQEKMTRDHARDAYGVELEPESFTVDTVATASRRGKGNTE
jgi:N-methylhydantoinase B